MIQYRATFRNISQNVRSCLALESVEYPFTNRKYLKLCKCLDIDNMTYPSKIGEITWPITHFMGRSVFTNKLFSPLHILFCTIANLEVIYLKFLGSIFDVNTDDPAKFCEVSMIRSCISKKQAI